MHFIWHTQSGLTPATQRAALVHPQTVELLDCFQPGAIAVASINSRDNRFVLPKGFSRSELLAERSFMGYFQCKPATPPRPIRMLVDEIVARATGLTVLSPRGKPDGVETVDYEQNGLPARLILLYRDHEILREEFGLSGKRPELAEPAAKCVADGCLYVTSETDRQIEQFAGGKRESQGVLFAAPGSLAESIASAEIRGPVQRPSVL